MAFLKALTTAAALLSAVNANPLGSRQTQGLSFDYNNEKVRGVNLGGWFVLEPWITPSIFEPYLSDPSVVDEYTLSAKLGPTAARNLLEAHWTSWITEDDFSHIKAVGLNHVRIPIGYWALAPIQGDPYVQGQLDVLDRAIGWARTYGIKVMLDLHGAPGSQNGFDNSGRKGPVLWQQGDTVAQTRTALVALTDRYAADQDVVTAIELLNEPASFDGLSIPDLQQFYYDGFGITRVKHQYTAVTIHDAFLPPSQWNGFMGPKTQFQDIVLDTHIYQVFSDAQLDMNPEQHIQNACQNGPMLAALDKWTIVGEWTGAQTDCAKWLNGLGTGARYDGTFAQDSSSPIVHGSCQTKDVGTVDGLLDVDKYNLKRFVEAQMDAYEQRTGWIFWAWKTESAPEWHFKNLTIAGLIPQPLDARTMNLCG